MAASPPAISVESSLVFTMHPLSDTPPAGCGDNVLRLYLVRHAQGARFVCPSAAAAPFAGSASRPSPRPPPPPHTRTHTRHPPPAAPAPHARPLCRRAPGPAPPPPAGTHNLAVANSGGADGGLDELEYKNEAWADARLTDFGREQSASAHAALAALPRPEVFYTSPLSRTIQTALIATPAGVPFVAEELVRERNGLHPCDRRRTRAELAADFPTVSLAALTTEADGTWTPAREPWDALVARAGDFLRLLAARPQRTVAVCTHNDFLQALLLEAPELKASDPALRKKFANAEVMPLWLTWEVAAQGGLPSERPAPESSPRQ